GRPSIRPELEVAPLTVGPLIVLVAQVVALVARVRASALVAGPIVLPTPEGDELRVHSRVRGLDRMFAAQPELEVHVPRRRSLDVHVQRVDGHAGARDVLDLERQHGRRRKRRRGREVAPRAEGVNPELDLRIVGLALVATTAAAIERPTEALVLVHEDSHHRVAAELVGAPLVVDEADFTEVQILPGPALRIARLGQWNPVLIHDGTAAAARILAPARVHTSARVHAALRGAARRAGLASRG